MIENASRKGPGRRAAGRDWQLLVRPDDPVVARTAQRALARHQALYAEEVRVLLAAALDVMRRYGTDKSPRVADILEVAGLSRDAFYRHFASKEDLVAAIVEAGAQRLVQYLEHQMGKQKTPAGKLRQWVQGIMAQAGDPEVAHSTRAVLWNGGQVRHSIDHGGLSTSEQVAGLIQPVLAELGSCDPARDAAVISNAVMGRMRDFLWSAETPSRLDVEHLVRFCMAAIQPTAAPANGG